MMKLQISRRRLQLVAAEAMPLRPQVQEPGRDMTAGRWIRQKEGLESEAYGFYLVVKGLVLFVLKVNAMTVSDCHNTERAMG